MTLLLTIPVRFLIRRSVRYLLVSHGFRLIQAVVVLAALSFVLTGSRIAAIDQYGNRADIVASIFVTIATIALLTALNRRVMTAIDRRFFREAQRAMKTDRVDSLQPPYSLIRPEVEDAILPFCENNGIGVIVYSPMMSGLLSGKMTRERINNFPEDDWRKNNPEFQEPRLYRNLWLAELLKNIGRHHGLSAGEIAIAWTLRSAAVTGAIVGGRNPDQVDGIVGAADLRLSGDEIDGIDRFARANVWLNSEAAA